MSNKQHERPHIRQKAFEDLNVSAIEDHARQGKKLVPPFGKLSMPLTMSSWRDACIPNILWACILAAHMPREHYLDLFRRIVAQTREKLPNYEQTYVTHNFLAVRTPEEFQMMMSPLVDDPDARKFVSALLIVDCLPDRPLWAQVLEAPIANEAWSILGRTVIECLDHQSQISTDVRWLKLIHMAIMGKMHFPTEMSELVEELRLYPNKGDMRKVRPFIRATEMSLRSMEGGEEQPKDVPDPPSAAFWLECKAKTACIVGDVRELPNSDTKALVKELLELSEAVAHHFDVTNTDTGIDPRLDSTFGLVLYALALTTEMAHAHNHALPGGRILLRSLVEAFITLRFLAHKDDPAIWKQYRNYGSGQAKLAFLKNLREDDVPEFIDLKQLEAFANEDMWMEYQEIPLGAWANSDLRKMATEAGCKDVYDKYYSWASGFAHGHWICVRDAVFTTCLNPLHRLHRIPVPPRPMLSTLQDACALVNRMLEDLTLLYPPFKRRLRWHKQPKTATSAAAATPTAPSPLP